MFFANSRLAMPTEAVRGGLKSLRLPLEGLKEDGRSGLVFVDGPGDIAGETVERS